MPPIILTGPPGAGKTTIARLLAPHLPRSVHLHTDDFWHYITAPIPPHLPEAHTQNTAVMNIIATTTHAYTNAGYQVICDGIIGPWFLPTFGPHPLHYIVLTPTEPTTLTRATTREAPALTDQTPILSLHRQFASLGPLAHHALDTTTLTPAQTTTTILNALTTGAYLLTP
ncbi:AAA family ATPase [Actinokineospora globicatena]|uniref:AAA family ATPase n=1 Tax=Actinokineospora globicatena TaxID=103729 RepID=UPI0020A309F5|nr:AAA family ATPase [Actinokineospora globicatena]MCP2304419.1 AAA domain-containing protein [Actinokineospora globicatena]GLW78216.1 hypothetical protein Aglo01_26980 [Actinokineospora globicatena]GLW85118.1 hypothetical protein Aglo02_27580 [Actinokineospora globicatena]